jgi:hypothetical protein
LCARDLAFEAALCARDLALEAGRFAWDLGFEACFLDCFECEVALECCLEFVALARERTLTFLLCDRWICINGAFAQSPHVREHSIIFRMFSSSCNSQRPLAARSAQLKENC